MPEFVLAQLVALIRLTICRHVHTSPTGANPVGIVLAFDSEQVHPLG